MKKCTIICNPQSGQNDKKQMLNDFKEILNKYNYELNYIFTEYKGHATKITKELPDIDLLIVAGGDGTLNEVVAGNLQRTKPLLMANLPLGTINDVGKMYGYTSDKNHDLEMLLNGTIKNIDTCLLNDRAFVYVAGFGNYVDVAFSTPRELKEKYGKLAYMFEGLKKVPAPVKSFKLKYKVDNKIHYGQYSFIFVTNTTRVAGIDNIYPDAKLDDNMFEVILSPLTSKIQILKTITMFKTTDLDKLEGVEYYRTNNFEIEFENIPDESWCLDGEEYTIHNQKLKFSINKKLNMLVPKENVNKLFIDKK